MIISYITSYYYWFIWFENVRYLVNSIMFNYYADEYVDKICVK